MEPLQYKGKYAECLVFTDEIEELAVTQIYGFLNHPAFENTKIRIMPDIHTGAGAVIGFTSTLSDKIIPNVIGVDIGCGVYSLNLGKNKIDFAKLDQYIRKKIPYGLNVRGAKVSEKLLAKAFSTLKQGFQTHEDMLDQIRQTAEATEQKVNYTFNSLGTLGNGNHFIELGQDQFEDKWLTIHTGSRNFGLKIALFHQNIAKEKHPFGALSYLEKEDADFYLKHMRVAQTFAAWNRRVLAEQVLEFLEIVSNQRIESVHNYIDLKNRYIRKGAISAQKDEPVIIPWNMKDGLILGKGKGNEDWNFSAPHGAGRKYGRKEAKRTFSLEEFEKEMKSIFTTCVNKDTLDESPMAYKNPEHIESFLGPSVEITHRVKPLYNFKASGDE